MSDGGNSAEVDWEHVGRLELHPRRFGLLYIFALDGGRTLSPTECSYELHTNVADANYHISVLEESGILRLVHTRRVRGTKEHFYCLVGHSAEDVAERLERPKKDE